MKKNLLILALSIVLISSVFALYTNDSNSKEKTQPSITVAKDVDKALNKTKEAIEKDLNETKKEIRENVNKAIEAAKAAAKQNKQHIKNRVQQAMQKRNQLNLAIQQRLKDSNYSCPKNCSCSGATIKCSTKEGREMSVIAGNSGNIIVQTKNQNKSGNFSTTTNVELYHHKGAMFGKFKNNQTKKINITPDQIQNKIKQKLRLRIENHSRINLTENGTYEIQTKKHSRLFGMIPVKEKMHLKMDPETGEIIEKNTRSWWGFLARDIREK